MTAQLSGPPGADSHRHAPLNRSGVSTECGRGAVQIAEESVNARRCGGEDRSTSNGAEQLLPEPLIADGRYRLLVACGGPDGLQFWQALDTTRRRHVALTLVNPDGAITQGDIGQIVSRTLRLSRLGLPGVAQVLNVARLGPGVLVVAEWIRGASLPDVAHTAPSAVGAARAMEHLLAAAEIAHSAGLALSVDHPSRVRVSVEGQAVLAFPATLPNATDDGDLRGLGAALYALLANRWPLPESATAAGLPPAELELQPKELASINPRIPWLISAATAGALRPRGGIGSAATLRNLLEQATGEIDQAAENPQATTNPPVYPLHRRGGVSVLAGLSIGAAILIIVLVVLASALSHLAGNTNSGVSLDKNRLGLHGLSTPPPPPPAGELSGHVIKPVQATVFSPGGGADNPQSARFAIDGDPSTTWSTDVYFDPVPFPGFKQGVGLLLQLPQPTVVTAVTVDLDSMGTVTQIRSAPTATPVTLDDTAQLTAPTPLHPGHNIIPVNSRTSTSTVLLWISTLGTTIGQSRSDISEITVHGAS